MRPGWFEKGGSVAGDVFSRLHATAPRAIPVEAVPNAVSERFAEAQITGDHLAGLLVWFAVGPPVAIGAWLLLNVWSGVVVMFALVAVPAGCLVVRSGRRSRELIVALPDVIDMLARSLHSGASLRRALQEAAIDAPRVVGDELRPVVQAIERGQRLSAALDAWVLRSPLPEVRVVAAALSLASEHEPGATRALAGVAQTLRDRRALTAEIRALTAQASASMQALVLLPVAFLALDAASNRHVVRFLVNDGLGRACLVAGTVLDLVGLAWMRLLIRRRVPT